MDKLEEIADISGSGTSQSTKRMATVVLVSTATSKPAVLHLNLVGQLGARAGLYDAATVRVNATGSISVMVGAHSHGQAHETAFPQVVAEMLGIDESMIEIVHGDSSKIPFGMGTYGSRSIAVCGSAMVRATEKIINKARKSPLTC